MIIYLTAIEAIVLLIFTGRWVYRKICPKWTFWVALFCMTGFPHFILPLAAHSARIADKSAKRRIVKLSWYLPFASVAIIIAAIVISQALAAEHRAAVALGATIAQGLTILALPLLLAAMERQLAAADK